MFLPIVVYGHPVLRRVSEDITPDYPGLEKLVQDMFYTMDEADGVGLAAPQIGLNIRLFVRLDVRTTDILQTIYLACRAAACWGPTIIIGSN